MKSGPVSNHILWRKEMSVPITYGNVVKRFEKHTIIPGLSLKVRDGELFTLLGPSGCGKTTLLRMTAGFNTIEGGEIYFGDRLINEISAHKRNIGMVFQNYAIFPHLTVRENVEYGLNVRKLSKKEKERKVDEILKITQIEEYKDRLPEKLSGGQQQRVALARAIVIHPDVLLMDEPLSNLDAKLRVEMRDSIRRIQKEIGITTIYVTHDQEEALAISDRIAVMKDGIIQQVGTPREIYLRPSNVFVSTFIGHSNIIEAKIVINNASKFVEFPGGYRIQMNSLVSSVENGQKVSVSVRPEELLLGAKEGLKGKILFSTFLGKFINYEVGLDIGMDIELYQNIEDSAEIIPTKSDIVLGVNEKKVNVFTEDGSRSLIGGVSSHG
jgi:iron(III) transport system ATP-binding protein